uniref:DUF4939 domain-containing protein n=1 Tax=Gopherus evgoodei TaxID=1825980 RepID=A0A8C4YBK4_9SAUR
GLPCPKQRPAISLPEEFDRNCRQFWGFMNQCHLQFLMRLKIYSSDQFKVALVVSLLTGNALDYVSPQLEGHSPVLLNQDAFLQSIITIFDDPH